MRKTLTTRLSIAVILSAALLVSMFAFVFGANGSSANAQTITSTSASSNQALLQFEWPQFMGDAEFSRLGSGPAPSTSDILWKADMPNIMSYLAAFNGMIFACTNTAVVALDRDTGNKVWSTQIPMNSTETWPAAYKIDDTHMVVEGTCLDPNTGNIIWTSNVFSQDTGNFNANVYSPEEKMFYIKNLAYVEAWRLSDPNQPPTLAWTMYVPGGGRVGSGIAYGEGKVFPGSFQDLQMAIDAKTGKVLWTTPTKTAMIFTGSYYQGMFLRGGTDDNTMYCFNATNGDIIWTYRADTNGYFTSGTAAAYDMVYSPNKDGNIYAINIATGKVAWKYQGPGTMLFPGMPTVADGKVYVTSGQNATFGQEVGASEFVCLNAYTGEPYWKLPIEAYAPRESVAVAYGKLYIIPGDVTTAVDAISGSEYNTKGQVWCFGSNTSPVKGASWPMFRNDAVRDSLGTGGPSNLTMVWKYTTNGAVMSSPSIENGIVYVGSQDKNIYAINAWTGALVWSYATGGTIESSAAVANGKVYIGSDDGYVYCNDATNGNRLWRTFVNGGLPKTYGSAVMLRSSPAVVGNTVYIGSMDDNLYALDANSGTVSWKFTTQGPITSSPTISDGAVYITSEEPAAGALYKIDAAGGGQIWKKQLEYEQQFTGGTDMQGTPTVAAGMVFASANLRTFYGIDAATGDIAWTFTNPTATEFIVSSPIYLNGQLFIIDKFDIACLNATTGKQLWSSYSGDELYVSPSYADDQLYVATSQRHIFIINATDGSKTLAYTTPSASWSSPTPCDGRLFIGCNDWNVYSFTATFTSAAQSTGGSTNAQVPEYVYIIAAAAFVVAIAVVGAYAYLKTRKNKSAATSAEAPPS
jgi:outer membrane protein assembly factor BamB